MKGITGPKTSALAVRQAVEFAHPEITILTPLTSLSGLWELTTDDGTTTYYDDCEMMLDHLERRFGGIEAELRDRYAEIQVKPER